MANATRLSLVTHRDENLKRLDTLSCLLPRLDAASPSRARALRATRHALWQHTSTPLPRHHRPAPLRARRNRGRILTPTFARTAWQKTSACLPPARELARPRAPVRSGVRALVEDRFRWRLRRSEAPETIRSGTLRYWLC